MHNNVTLSLAEIQIPGSCRGTDPEVATEALNAADASVKVSIIVELFVYMQDPTCAKVSISGAMSPVPEEGLEEAEHLLFSRHPAMKTWPVGHHFTL